MRRSVALSAALLALALGPVAGGAAAAPAVTSPCPGDQGDPTTSGWALSTTTFENAYTRHAYVGNGYLSQRVPATGTGYVGTTQATGWPLFTPAYDGAFVAGFYGTHAKEPPNPAEAAIAAIPTWSTLKVGVGPDTYTATTPAGQISDFRQTLFLRCGVLRTALTWTPSAGRATDLVYDVIAARNSPHVGAVRMTMTPRWSGPATVTDVIDGAGARRVSQTGGGAVPGARTVDVAFQTSDGKRRRGRLHAEPRRHSRRRPRARRPRRTSPPARRSRSMRAAARPTSSPSSSASTPPSPPRRPSSPPSPPPSRRRAEAGPSSSPATPPRGPTSGRATSSSPGARSCRTGCARTSTRSSRASAPATTTASPRRG